MANKKNTRARDLLVSRGLAVSTAQAEALILAGRVVAISGGRQWRIEKAGELLYSDVNLRIKAGSVYVSRGGEKLHSAIDVLGLSGCFTNNSVLDVGASTGGFTDCVLNLGARTVIALDVGKNQLAWKLRTDPRVTILERTHICKITRDAVGAIDWILADVSFNSLVRIMPCIVRVGSLGTRLLLLVKPQFELPRQDVPVGGVIKDKGTRIKAIASVKEAMAQNGILLQGQCESGLVGRSGNQETFILGQIAALKN